MGLSGSDVLRLGAAAQKQVMEKLKARQVRNAETNAKYHNEKVQRTLPGGKVITFDSKREARRFDELFFQWKADEISDLRLQPQFTLQDGYITLEGERVRPIKYVADFSYWRDGELIVEDAKSPGTRTQAYLLKRKWMLSKYGISVKEV